MSIFRMFRKEENEEVDQFRSWLKIGVLVLVCGWVSCHELKYAIVGRNAEAQITRIKPSTIKHRGESERMTDVHYRWTDPDDGEREDVLREPGDWSDAVGKPIDIDYLPGVKDSRLAGTRNYFAVSAFGIAVAVALFWFVKMWREGTRHPATAGKIKDAADGTVLGSAAAASG